MRAVEVNSIGALPASADLWISSHGFESRSIAHLDRIRTHCSRSVSFGFEFPKATDPGEPGKRVAAARDALNKDGFETPVGSDAEFDEFLRGAVEKLSRRKRCRVIADISSMSRSRIASVLFVVAERNQSYPCELQLIYFPGSFESHKHSYEPLQSFGPCHANLSGWPADPDAPLALILGLGTEPRRADGVVEMLEPDILALYMAVGDENEYSTELKNENRRVLEVGGEPMVYSLRDPSAVHASLVFTGQRMADRARVIFVPLGPKLFSAMCMTAALALGEQVGVWKASAGSGVQPVDVTARGAPILLNVQFGQYQTSS
jgi:hypothetical protein